MNLHIIFQGPPERIIPIVEWCKEANVTYFLTQIIVESNTAPCPLSNEHLNLKRFWSQFDGQAIVHTWDQPQTPDQFRAFKQMTFSMNRASITRWKRSASNNDLIVYFDAFTENIEPRVNPFLNLDSLADNIVLSDMNKSSGEVNYHFFITRPHNFDRISQLWKRRNNPIFHTSPANASVRSAWWKWLRLLKIKVTKI
jgi:hypothetical protein